ncbi:hypothetical protein V8E54_001736, partial [Elaphomyces granulatus]
MDSKYCSGCLRDLPLSSFLASDGLGDRIFATCISCRNRQSSRRPGNTRKIEKRESRVQKEADYRAIRARRDSETRTRTEAVEAEKTARVQKEQEKEQGRARREAEKKTARVQKEQEKEQCRARREAEKKTARVQKEQEKEQDRARREAQKKTAQVQKEQEEERGRARREAEKVARLDARTEDLAIRNERLAYVQQNTDEDDGSRHDGMGEGGGGTTRARRPAAAAHVRTFPPDTADYIPSCLEEEFPRFATATENFPPEITKDNIRQRYNDYQSHIDWCANRSPCGICGGSFQSDSVSLYSQQRLIDLENRHELDSCAVHDDGVTLCSNCGRDLEAIMDI